MIVTAKNTIPLLWQFAIAAPWGALRFKYMIMGAVFVFSMKKFIENPAEITFLMSIPGIVTIAVAPIVSFMSDRVWTRWGRRKIFTVPSIIGIVAAFIAMPLMPNIWGLILLYVFYEICNDFGNATFEVLKQEVVPPKQRGTAAAIGTWLQTAGNLMFYLVALGRFDDYQFYAGFPVTGEQSLYWGVALIIAMMALIVILGVKETYQPSKLRGERLTVRNFIGGLLNKDLWPVYLLVVGWIVSNAGLGSLTVLLYTEQWGFTKQELGLNVAIGSSINIFLIILIGMFADKLPRMKSFEILLFISILIELTYYIYVEFILFDKTPSLVEVILFGEMAAVTGIILGMLYTPLAYDYIPRNEMGTFVAGRNITAQVLRIITLNGIGVFIALYSSLFLPPGGDMTRITLADVTHQETVEERLRQSPEAIDNGHKLTARTYFATNAAFKEGRAFEIRRHNEAALQLKEEIDALTNELQAILAKKSNAEAAAARAEIAGDQQGISEALADAALLGEEATPIEAKIDELRAQQAEFAEAFLVDIRGVLGDSLMEEGSQILNSRDGIATLYEIPLKSRPDTKDIARTLSQLRIIRPDLIDLRLQNRDLDFYLTASVRGEHTDAAFAAQLAGDFQSVAESRIGDSLVLPVVAINPEVHPTVSLHLTVIEDPLDNYISPITRVIYGVWDHFGDPPTPERRIWAMARSLRQTNGLSHVGVWDATKGKDHAIVIEAIYTGDPVTLPESAPPRLQSARERLADFMTPGNPAFAQALDLYGRSIDAAAGNRITIPLPILETRFAPPKFDYMSGYLWMIFMSSAGLGICLLFTRRERKGLIHKRGLEESNLEAEAEQSRIQTHTESHEFYRPGYFFAKVGMAVVGLGMLAFGLVELAPTLGRLMTGESSIAIATKVAKERIGGEATFLYSDAEVIEAKERFDRSYVFWNYFKFEDAKGQLTEFRVKTGKQLQPAYNLRDSIGLPTTVTVYYDPENPQQAVVAANYATWFLSGWLVFFGSITTLFGIVLAYHARKPIAMPVILSEDKTEESSKNP